MTTFSVYTKAGVDRRLAALAQNTAGPQVLDTGAHTRPDTGAGNPGSTSSKGKCRQEAAVCDAARAQAGRQAWH